MAGGGGGREGGEGREAAEEKCVLALPCSRRRHPAISHQEEKINVVGDKASFCDCLKMNY